MIFGHEFAETVTDPYPNSGWRDLNDTSSGGEIGDKCAWVRPYGNVLLFTGNYAMQSLWSNVTNSGVLTVPFPDQVSVTNPGEQNSYSPSRVLLQIPASSSTGSALAWHWSGLPRGLSAAASGGTLTISGNPGAGYYQVTVEAADATGGMATVSFDWLVEKLCTPGC